MMNVWCIEGMSLISMSQAGRTMSCYLIKNGPKSKTTGYNTFS